MTWSITDLDRLKQSGKIRDYRVVNPAVSSNISSKKSSNSSKYGNVKTICDNITFDSAKEARRYQELKLLLAAGEISELKLQVKYQLNEGGTHKLYYVADFVYLSGKVLIVEDVKPFSKGEYYLTPTFKKKMKLMKKIHGINIKLI